MVSKVATAHIASIGIGTILIASMITQSTLIYVYSASYIYSNNIILLITGYCLTLYLLTHTCSVVGGDLVSKVATAHIASIGIGTILIASMNA